jgi:hypothetical protein
VSGRIEQDELADRGMTVARRDEVDGGGSKEPKRHRKDMLVWQDRKSVIGDRVRAEEYSRQNAERSMAKNVDKGHKWRSRRLIHKPRRAEDIGEQTN